MSSGVSILLRQAEVDYINQVRVFILSHEKILGFDVPVQKMPRVEVFYPRNHLIGQHKYSSEREGSSTRVE